jgi:hypothetical protein
MFVQMAAAERQHAQALAHMYDPSWRERPQPFKMRSQLLVANGPVLIPMSFGQARKCLTYLQAIIDLGLGGLHPWTLVNLGAFYRRLVVYFF